MAKILCVEDGQDTILILRATFPAYELICASSVAEAGRLLREGKFDLILLDIGLPDGNGLELLLELESREEGIPVVLLTGKNDLLSKASAFSLGAEDFVHKPFDPRELKIRVDAKLRKFERMRASMNSFRIGDVICDVSGQRIYRKDAYGKEHKLMPGLTVSEFKIFSLLARCPNKIFSRAEILERVWGSDLSVSDRSVDVHISNLRKKVAKVGLDVEAVVGVGYRCILICPVLAVVDDKDGMKSLDFS